jgi:hypothetical protein
MVAAREPLALVQRARRVLSAIIVGAALLWGAAVGVALSVALPWSAAFVAAVACVAWLLWRGRGVRSLDRVALWVEERDPRLQYTLVTSVELATRSNQNDAGGRQLAAGGYGKSASLTRERLARVVADRGVEIAPMLARAARRRLGTAAAVLLVAVIMSVGLGERLRRVGSTLTRAGQPTTRGSNPLEGLVVTVTPPAYAHRPPEQLRDPERIRALVGSTIAIDGPGERGVRAQLGAAVLGSLRTASGWRVTALMPASAALVVLSDTSGLPRATTPGRRTLLLEPLSDAPPTVVLAMPARDTIQAHPRGVLELLARAADDIGLADARFEVIVSAGREDAGGVHDRVLTIGRQQFASSRSGEIRDTVPWSTVGATPGSVISVRAIAEDGNTVSGPGIGVSETRTIRVASPEDSGAIVEGAVPPSLDSGSLDSTRVRGPRLYLRGAPPRIAIDVNKVRLTGSVHPDPGPWSPAEIGDSLRTRWTGRLVILPDLARPRAGTTAPLLDSLLAWRVETPSSSSLVAPLDSAIDLVRAKQDPRRALSWLAAIVTGGWRSAEGLGAGGGP